MLRAHAQEAAPGSGQLGGVMVSEVPVAKHARGPDGEDDAAPALNRLSHRPARRDRDANVVLDQVLGQLEIIGSTTTFGKMPE